MSEYQVYLSLLKEQRKCFGRLLQLSESLLELTADGEDVKLLFTTMGEREDCFTQIRELDAELSRIMSIPENESFKKQEAAAGLRDEMMAIVQKTVDSDSLLEKKFGLMREEVLNELSNLGKAKQTAAGYGKRQKPIFAKFIDFKH